MQIIYNRSFKVPEFAVFAELSRAESVSAVHKAIESAATWRDFRTAIPPAEWDDIVEGWAADGTPEPEEAFDSEVLGGYSDGYYPSLLRADMLRVVPPDLAERFGSLLRTTLDEDALEVLWEKADGLAEGLRCRGHEVTFREDLRID